MNTFYPSSKTCSHCGNVKSDLKLSDRVYHCGACGVAVDRGFNASVNLVKHLVGRAPAQFTLVDMTALLDDCQSNGLVTSMVETGIQQKPLKFFSIDRIL
ncbi:zinc ribbon domain-containing protein [Helicobacter bizzozeronii]|uniref:zinc ribbon domain-containing protein n=1 Tax=Helicobacter bizzozeronii TaxID=56877 RepID=UPI002D7667BA|nr:zinc ribbon domain-containing protein [Helicobacter bizzozeronii]